MKERKNRMMNQIEIEKYIHDHKVMLEEKKPDYVAKETAKCLERSQERFESLGIEFNEDLRNEVIEGVTEELNNAYDAYIQESISLLEDAFCIKGV